MKAITGRNPMPETYGRSDKMFIANLGWPISTDI